jgi:hypothetical protein
MGFMNIYLRHWMKYVCIDDYGEAYGSEIEPTPEIDKCGKRIWSAGDNRWYVLIENDVVEGLGYGLYEIKRNWELKRIEHSEQEKIINDIDDNIINFIINTNTMNGIDFKIFRIYSPVVSFVPFSQYGGTVEKYSVRSDIIGFEKEDFDYLLNNIEELRKYVLKYLYENSYHHDIYVYDIKTLRKKTGGTITIRYFRAHKNYRDWAIHLGGI